MSDASTSDAGHRRFGQDWAHRIQTAIPVMLLLVLPILLPFARRAGPLVLTLAAALGGYALWRLRGIKFSLHRFTKTGACLALFFLWAALSLAWSPWPSRGAYSWMSSAALVFAAAVVLAQQTTIRSSRAHLLLTIGLGVGSAIILVDLWAGLPMLKMLYSRPDAFRYNMVLVTFLPLVVALFSSEQRVWNLGSGLITFSLFIGAVLLSESETAKLAMALAISVYGFAFLVPRQFAWWAMAALISAVWLLAPWTAAFIGHAKPLVGSLGDGGSATERLEIWRGFGEMARAGLPWGWGMDASPAAKLTAFFEAASVETRKNVSWLHPHSIPLQIYVELGIPGAFLGWCLSVLALPSWKSHATKVGWASSCAFFSVVLTVSLISHGAWQTWWWAAVSLGIFAMQLLHKQVDA